MRFFSIKKIRRRVGWLAILLMALLLSAPTAWAIPFTERDYMSERQRLVHGVVARPGDGYTLSLTDDRFYEEISFEMSKQRALFVEIRPLTRPAGVLMLVTQPGTPRSWRAVWGEDDVAQPIRFWTDHFWRPSEACSAVGCPKIKFISTHGEAEIIIIDIRLQPFSY
jgi:hypothetical protein